MTVCFSFILPTTGRPSLAFAAWAVTQQMEQHDELIIAGGGEVARDVASSVNANWLDMPPGKNWGFNERREAIMRSVGTHLMFIDDDDAILPRAVQTIREAVSEAPLRPHVFKIVLTDGRIIPIGREIREGNVGSPSMIVPNVWSQLGQWTPRYAGDFDFIQSTLRHYPDGPAWHDEVIYACREFGRKAWESDSKATAKRQQSDSKATAKPHESHMK